MSADNLAWALAFRTGQPRLKLVLLLLADGAGIDGFTSPDMPRLADRAELSEAEVKAAIADLLQIGALEACEDDDFPLRVAVPIKPAVPSLTYGVSASRWAALRKQVFTRDGHSCTYCGSTELPLHCDHVTPWSKGGATVLENLTTACKICNVEKRARTPAEWRGACQ